MDVGIWRWERRDNAHREPLGQSALALCRALRGFEGVSSARFYWSNNDTVVILAEADSAEVFYRPPSPELAGAFFDVADLAHQISFEPLVDAKAAEAVYRATGR